MANWAVGTILVGELGFGAGHGRQLDFDFDQGSQKNLN
jgi:hypothetical protein